MTPPADVFAELRQLRLRELRKRPITVLEYLGAAVLIAAAVVLLARYGQPLFLWIRRMRWNGGNLAMMILMTPVVIIIAMASLAYTRWRNRGTVPFAFPVIVDLPRWRLFRKEDDVVYLTDGPGLIALVVRPDANEPLDDVLAALDPAGAFTGRTATPGGVKFAHAGAYGLLMKLADPHACALVLVPRADRPAILAGVLLRSKTRTGNPQKWRPLEAPVIAAARARRVAT